MGLLIAASIHVTFRPQTSAPSPTKHHRRALGFTPGGLPTVAAVLPKSICFAKLQPKSATSARWDSTFLRALPEASRCKHRHLTGSARLSAQHPLTGRVISIHDVRSAGAVLDVLESHGLLIPNPDSPATIFHWFSGTSDELVARVMRAVIFRVTNGGCSATKRGREYARQIPLDRLLLETDAPAEANTETSAQSLINDRFTWTSERHRPSLKNPRRRVHRVGSFSKCALCF